MHADRPRHRTRPLTARCLQGIRNRQPPDSQIIDRYGFHPRLPDRKFAYRQTSNRDRACRERTHCDRSNRGSPPRISSHRRPPNCDVTKIRDVCHEFIVFSSSLTGRTDFPSLTFRAMAPCSRSGLWRPIHERGYGALFTFGSMAPYNPKRQRGESFRWSKI